MKDLLIRDFRIEDMPAALSLMNGCFPTQHTQEWWHWKYNQNVFGKSIVLVAEKHGKIVGLRGFWRWDFAYHGRVLRAAAPVDACVAPEYRRRGVFTALTVEALQQAARQNLQFLYGFPGKYSTPGYLRLGWSCWDEFEWYIKPLRLARMSWRSLRYRNEHRHSLPLDKPIDANVLRQWKYQQTSGLISTRLLSGFLNWRYAQRPDVCYGIAGNPTEDNQNIGIYRLDSRRKLREFLLVDVIGFTEASLETLTKNIIDEARRLNADYILVPKLRISTLENSLRKHGFFTFPVKKINLTCKVIDSSITQLIENRQAWLITLGNSDIF